MSTNARKPFFGNGSAKDRVWKICCAPPDTLADGEGKTSALLLGLRSLSHQIFYPKPPMSMIHFVTVIYCADMPQYNAAT